MCQLNLTIGSLCLFHSFQIERDSRSLCSCYYLGVKGIFNESDAFKMRQTQFPVENNYDELLLRIPFKIALNKVLHSECTSKVSKTGGIRYLI